MKLYEFLNLSEDKGNWYQALTVYRDAFEKSKIIPGSGSLESYHCTLEYLNKVIQFSCWETLPEKGNYIPEKIYLLVKAGTQKILAMGCLRLGLNDRLRQKGGNIGYSVHPDYRKLGLGKVILPELLEEAKKHHFNKVLLTCDETNLASAKIIESCGGVLMDKIEIKGNPALTKRYWIQLNSSSNKKREER